MKRISVSVAVVIMTLGFVMPVMAGQGPVETIANGCKQELSTYCKEVTPGNGRVLACLYAYGDKLSNKCEYALYDAGAQLERAVNAMTYVANECMPDLKKHCTGVKAGQGRLLSCLEKNKKDVSDRCKDAIMDVNLK